MQSRRRRTCKWVKRERPSGRRTVFIIQFMKRVIDILHEGRQPVHDDANKDPLLMIRWRKHNVISVCHGPLILASLKMSF
ncbi:hypothetical protein E2C01_007570 [Portunus trituberculatus]|uniref:Uncharacterized protein n=1 Tax=Portunus trituberculatus TaxID=210409 RepID=A0A5B7D0G6_PORTR|nr:hypothetical protein [Portunus trituberculatus]